MEEKWLYEFYRMCDNNLAIARKELFQTNFWGLTVATAIFTIIILNSVDNDGNFIPLNFTFWYLIIFVWIIMLRFFVRSCIGRINIQRWHFLMMKISTVLSLSSKHQFYPLFKRNCIDAIEVYYFNWKSPIKQFKAIKDSLILFYLWFMAPVLFFICWGLVSLDIHSIYWFIGLFLFSVPTLIEIFWFISYDGFEYKKIDDSYLPDIVQEWKKELANN